jgi:Icc-related predicted phosphoesterase
MLENASASNRSSTNYGAIKIAAVGDIHVRENDKGKWVDYFKEISSKADVLIICGDLTDTGDEVEAQVLADELKACSIPVVAVLGNHDFEKGRHKLIRKILQSDNVHILDGEAVVIKNIGFAGIKGFGGGFDNHMLSMFGEGAMKAFVQEAVDEALHLERALARLEQENEGIKKIAVLHYAPVSATVAGEPEVIYPFLGSSRLAEPLERQKVVAAFHGHAHAGAIEGQTKNGTKVYNVAKQVLAKSGYPNQFYLLEV